MTGPSLLGRKPGHPDLTVRTPSGEVPARNPLRFPATTEYPLQGWSDPTGPTPAGFYKSGPTNVHPIDHRYRFDYDPRTNICAELLGPTISLHLRHGSPGDSDMTLNGLVVCPGTADVAPREGDDPGGGGGGCFVSILGRWGDERQPSSPRPPVYPPATGAARPPGRREPEAVPGFSTASFPERIPCILRSLG